MRIGLIGVGRIGAAHAQVVRDHAAVDELVVADADPGRARKVADELGVSAADDVEAAFTGAEAVVVATSTDAHPALVVKGVRAGVPVFCEKPVAPDIAGTVAVLREVESAGATVQVGFQRRFDAGYTAARAALQRGELGELRRVHLVTADQEPPHADYIPRSGGLFRDCHVHDFDILRWVTGREVGEVYASGANRGADFFAAAGDVDESAALLTLDDQTLVTLQGSRYNGAGHDVRMELAGTAGSFAVGLSERTPLRSTEVGVDFPGGEPWPDYWHRFLPSYVAELSAFVDLAAGRRDNPCTVADALAAFVVAEAATLSRQQHRVVRIEEVLAR